MLKPIVWIFLLLASAFAGAHFFAVQASLYWYFWWFDILMHTSGGVLITLGLFSLGTFSLIKRQPKLWEVLIVLLAFVITWEVFEYSVGLYGYVAQALDTAQDILCGMTGGIVTYYFLKYLTK